MRQQLPFMFVNHARSLKYIWGGTKGRGRELCPLQYVVHVFLPCGSCFASRHYH